MDGPSSRQIGQRVPVEHLVERSGRFVQGLLQGTARHQPAGPPATVCAGHRGGSGLTRPDDLAESDLAGRTRQLNPAPDPPARPQVSLSPQLVHDLRQMMMGDAEGLGHFFHRHPGRGTESRVHQDSNCVIGEATYAHDVGNLF